MRLPFFFLLNGLLWLALPVLMAGSDDEHLLSLVGTLAEGKSAERAAAISDLAATGDPRLGDFFDAYRSGSIYLKEGQPYIGGEIVTNDDLDDFVPLTHVFTGDTLLDESGAPALVMVDDLELLDPNRKERKLARAAAFLLALRHPEDGPRLQAAKRCGFPPHQVEAIPVLEDLADNDPVERIQYTAAESLQLLHFGLATPGDEAHLNAAEALGVLGSLRGIPVLTEYLDDADSLDSSARERYVNALKRMEKHQGRVRVFDNVKYGLSTGSIYILMALGLAIIYGLMGVINMAHGEMMMVGAYTTFVVQGLFGHSPDTPQNHFFLFAIPASFLVAALVGLLIERLVVRKLYHRPFESLLATVGVSLILIQIVRLIFGDNQAANSPTWLVGSFEVARDMNLSFNRVFIFVLTVCCVVGVQALLRYTPLGLNIRATMQHRDMASCVGIDTGRVYCLTYMLGSGLAGLAGCALTTVSGITPDMGQNYIVDSFLIVVIGGVGELLGVICSGLGLGITVQLLENSWFSPVWAKIIVLTLVVFFIQFRPAGLFPPKGRLADV